MIDRTQEMEKLIYVRKNKKANYFEFNPLLDVLVPPVKGIKVLLSKPISTRDGN